MRRVQNLSPEEIELLEEYYNEYYPKNIIQLLNNGFSYEFINPENFTNFYTSRMFFSFFPSNLYLKKYEKNKLDFAEDLIQNGTYFPIFCKKNKNFIEIYQGNHRVYSLYLYNKIKKINRDFLFIFFPEGNQKINFLELEWYDFDFNNFKILHKKIKANYIQIE